MVIVLFLPHGPLLSTNVATKHREAYMYLQRDAGPGSFVKLVSRIAVGPGLIRYTSIIYLFADFYEDPRRWKAVW